VLTLPAAWIESASRSDSRPVEIVEIYDGTDTWRMTREGGHSLGHPAVVAQITPIASKLDPMTRIAEIGQLEVMIVDDMDADGSSWFRGIVVNHDLVGKRIRVLVGFADIAENDFVPAFTGVIENYTTGQGYISLECSDVWSVALGEQVTGNFLGEFPLTVASQILEDANFVGAVLDETSLDPATHDDISHWVVQRGHENDYYQSLSVVDPTEALTLVHEIAQLMDGSFVPNEAGLLRFVRFSTSASVRRHLTPDDYADFEQLDTYEHLYNWFNIRFRRRLVEANARSFAELFRAYDETSIARYAYPGATERRLMHRFETPWLESQAELREVVIAADAEPPFTIEIEGTHIGGFCGARVPDGWPDTGQNEDALVSEERPSYICVKDVDGGHDEIMKVEELILGTQFESRVRKHAQDLGLTIRPYSAVLTVTERALFETSAVAHYGKLTPIVSLPSGRRQSYVFDCTIPVAWAQEKLRRFADGAFTVRFRTSLRHHDLQVGDIVTMDCRRFLRREIDGLTDATKLEIIEKVPDWGAESPGVTFTCAFAWHDDPPFSVTSKLDPERFGAMPIGGIAAQTMASLGQSVLLSPRVITGLAVNVVSGLTVEVQAGTAGTQVTNASLDQNEQITVRAERDSYVSFDTRTRAVVVRAVPNNDPKPPLSSSEVLLAKVIADATSAYVADKRGLSSSGVIAGRITSGALSAATNLLGGKAINPNPNLQRLLR
jgi:hypothetical protein